MAGDFSEEEGVLEAHASAYETRAGSETGRFSEGKDPLALAAEHFVAARLIALAEGSSVSLSDSVEGSRFPRAQQAQAVPHVIAEAELLLMGSQTAWIIDEVDSDSALVIRRFAPGLYLVREEAGFGDRFHIATVRGSTLEFDPVTKLNRKRAPWTLGDLSAETPEALLAALAESQS